MSYAKRTDRNHGHIRAALRDAGWFVKDTSAIGRGWPDLYIARKGTEDEPARCLWVEIKDGEKSASRRQLTAAQVQLHKELAAAGFPVRVICSVAEVEGL